MYSNKRTNHERRILEIRVEAERRKLNRRKSERKVSKRGLLLTIIGVCVSWLTFILEIAAKWQ